MIKNNSKKILSIILCFMMLTSLWTTTAFARDIEIIPVESGNSLNMSVSEYGILAWDEVPGATGYQVVLTQPNITQLYTWETTNTFIPLITEMNNFKYNSGQYTLIVKPQGVSYPGGGDSMSYYYTSHVDKLETPNTLQWIGNKAAWEAVDGAVYYNVTLYNFSGVVVTKTITECLYDFTEYSPQDGWTFKVQACSNGTLSDKRNSDYAESPKKGSDTRTITPVDSGNSLNMNVSSYGILAWDEVSGATGYRVVLTKPNYSELYTWETTNTFIPLITDLDGFKYDSGQYTLVVQPQGVFYSGGGASMSYYYTSHVDKLETPNTLQWIGNKAAWEAVDGAVYYNVTLYNFSGVVATKTITECLYDFTEYSPKDGWTFKVQAESNGTLWNKRDSDFAESPALVLPKPTYEIELCVFDSTYTSIDGGTVSIQTDKGSDEGSSAEGIATENTSVTIKAVADPGYTFVAWKKSSPYVDDVFSTDATYTFNVIEELFLYAVFQETDPQATTYDINCVSYNISSNETGGTVRLITDKGGSGYAASQQKYATENTTVNVKAVPEPGYEFVEWRKGSPSDPAAKVSADETFEFNATEDVWLYAVFQQKATCTIECQPFDITNTKLAGGTVSIQTDIDFDEGASPEALQATRNTSVTIKAVADPGYEFVAWKESTPYAYDAFSTDATHTFIATGETFLYAVFQEKPEGNTVSGQVKSYDPGTETTVELKQNGVTKYDTVIEATSGSGQLIQNFSIDGVTADTYDLVVTKAGHLTYTITGVVVEDEALDLTENANAAISLITLLCGDINGDGNINVTDLNTVWNAANYNKTALGAANSMTDVNGDGNVNVSDLNIVWNAANYNKNAGTHCTAAY